MHGNIFVLFLLIFNLPISFANASENLIPKELVGRWKLVGVECKTGSLTAFGKGQQPTPPVEHLLMISANGEVEDRMVEYGKSKNPASYCETIYLWKWTTHDGIISRPMSNLQSRKGVGGYNCYKVFFPKIARAERDWPYELSGDLLKITHKEMSVKVQGSGKTLHSCESGSDFVQVYKLQQ